MAKREYKTECLVVLWDSDLCAHCEKCWRELPAVFNPNAKPWVKIDGAGADEVRKQVAKCPSGALMLSPSVRELVLYTFAGIGAISPALYASMLESIAEMSGRTVDDAFREEVAEIMKTMSDSQLG